MSQRINWSGVVIAGIGFFATRFTVSLALYQQPLRFYVAGVLPLAIGLGLAVFGVALTVADIDTKVVRTTALWCIIGMVSMLVFGLLTIYGTAPGSLDLTETVFRSYLSNFVIGGSVGGTLTGLYAARNRQQRTQLQQHTNRLVVLNRLLRHDVLNAITAIRGFTELDKIPTERLREVVSDRTSGVERTIEKVKHLTHRGSDGGRPNIRIDINQCLEKAISEVESRHPETNVSVVGDHPKLYGQADEQLVEVFSELLENAVIHASDTEPTVSLSSTGSTVRISIRDEGPGIPSAQQTLLEEGDIGEFDDPTTGFGLNLVRFYITEYGGTIETNVTESGSEVTISLGRVNPDIDERRPAIQDFTGLERALPSIVVTVFAALVAGISYGLVSEYLGGSVAGIGVFYGTEDPVVGWITHQFHSIVFGLMFIGLISVAPDRWSGRYRTYIGIGIGWALIVWAVAASFIAPLWLELSGITVPIPDFSIRLLANHLVWGLTLGILTATGHRYLLQLSTGMERMWDSLTNWSE